MMDKEIRKLSKVQLIEILYLISKENDEIREENLQLKARLDALIDEAIAAKQQNIITETSTDSNENIEVWLKIKIIQKVRKKTETCQLQRSLKPNWNG